MKNRASLLECSNPLGRCCHCQQGTAHTEALLPQQHYYPVIANGGTGLAKRNDLGWSEAIPRYNKKDMHFQKDFTLSRGGDPIQTEQTPYEIFISYSRKDNQPIHPGEAGWVSALHDHILADHRRFSTEPLAIFLMQQRSTIWTTGSGAFSVLCSAQKFC